MAVTIKNIPGSYTSTIPPGRLNGHPVQRPVNQYVTVTTMTSV
jgi:hypothetical protein